MLILGSLTDLEWPKPESWCRWPRLKPWRRIHRAWGWNNPSTTVGTPLSSPSGREKSQPLHHPLPTEPLAQGRHRDGAEGEQTLFLPFISYPAHTSQHALLYPRGTPLLGQTLPARLSIPRLLLCCSHRTDSWPWPPLTIHPSAGSAGSPSSPSSSSSSGTGRLDQSVPAAGTSCRWMTCNPLSQSHTSPGFSLWILSGTKVNFTLRIIYRLPASDCPQLWWTRQ